MVSLVFPACPDRREILDMLDLKDWMGGLA